MTHRIAHQSTDLYAYNWVGEGQALINEYKHIPEYRDKLVETFFSMVRWGSQVDLVLPLDDRFEFQLIWDDLMHVEAGTDRLVRVKRNQNIASAFG